MVMAMCDDSGNVPSGKMRCGYWPSISANTVTGFLSRDVKGKYTLVSRSTLPAYMRTTSTASASTSAA